MPPLSPKDYGPGYAEQKVTNLELAEKTIYARGGLAVPVHPLYGDVVRVDKATGRKTYGMINNELVLWLLCRPDMVPVVDFFYFPEERAEKFWYRLLNKGYTLACSGTSDAAFDVGRTPGDSHATYAKLDKVDGDSIVRAFREGRTMVSYFGAGVIIEIDGKTSGDKLLPGPQARTLVVDAYADPGKDFTLRVIRNGEVFEERNFTGCSRTPARRPRAQQPRRSTSGGRTSGRPRSCRFLVRFRRTSRTVFTSSPRRRSTRTPGTRSSSASSRKPTPRDSGGRVD